jgi:uncharacterized membrane protein YgcG
VRELLLVVMLVIHPLWVRGSVTEAVTPSTPLYRTKVMCFPMIAFRFDLFRKEEAAQKKKEEAKARREETKRKKAEAAAEAKARREEVKKEKAEAAAEAKRCERAQAQWYLYAQSTHVRVPHNTFIQEQEKEQGHQYLTEDGETPQARGNKGGEGTCSDESSSNSSGSCSSGGRSSGGSSSSRSSGSSSGSNNKPAGWFVDCSLRFGSPRLPTLVLLPVSSDLR